MPLTNLRSLSRCCQETSTPKPGGYGIDRDDADSSDRAGQWAQSLESSAAALAETQNSAQEVADRATAYFGNIESLRLLAMQIVQGSADRPGWRAADDVGDDWQMSGSGEGGALLGSHVRVVRADLSAAIGRMKTGAKQATVIEALNALYGGTGRSGRLGVISTDGGVGKQEVEWADVEGWWSVWASRLCAKAQDPGVLDQRRVKMRTKTDKDTRVTTYSIDVFEPNAHDQKMQRIAHSSHRYSEFDALRTELLTAHAREEVAELIAELPFPPKGWGIANLTKEELAERRGGLESWLTTLVKNPLFATGDGDAQLAFQAFIGVPSAQVGRKVHKVQRMKTIAVTDL